MSAFDKALHDAGIADYNLITLSSIIPPESEVVIKRPDLIPEEYGYKLYAVISKNTETLQGTFAWAVLGWMQDDEGKGVFVEQTGQSKHETKDKILSTFNSMKSYRPELEGKIIYSSAGIKCEDEPVCAIVAALYKTEKW